MIIEQLNMILSFIFVISLLVFIHEFGHYYIARKCGVKVEIFSIGFGKELFSIRDKNDTIWKVCLVPLGGYVKMFGDSSASSTPDFRSIESFTKEEKETAFYTQPVLKRIAIVIAGPLANYLLAIIIISFFLITNGRSYNEPVISEVVKNSVAEKVGIIAGDRILELNNEKIDDFNQIRTVLALYQDDEITLKIDRTGEILEFTLIPENFTSADIAGNEVKQKRIGIASNNVAFKKVEFYQAPFLAIVSVYDTSVMTLKYLKQILVGKRDSNELGGIIRIAKYSGEASKHGIYYFLWFISALSINLGLFNLLPIPLLDGGHLFFYLVELITRRRIPEKIQAYAFKAGFVVLLLLFAVATYNDIKILM